MKWYHGLAAALVAAIWGCNYVAAKIGMEVFPPFFYTGLRFALLSAMLVPFVPRPDPPRLKRIAAIAMTLCVGHMATILLSLHMGLTIAANVLVIQLGVPFSCLLGAIFLRDRLGPWRTFGMAVAFAGVAIIAGNPDVLANIDAFAVGVLSAFLWGVANIQMKRMGEVPVLQFLAWLSVFAAPPLIAISWAFDGSPLPSLAAATPAIWLAVAYTTLGSTLGAYGLWAWLIGRFPVSRVAPYSLLTPVFGIAAGQLFFAEELTLPLIAGGAVTILGVAIITIRRPRLAALGKSA